MDGTKWPRTNLFHVVPNLSGMRTIVNRSYVHWCPCTLNTLGKSLNLHKSQHDIGQKFKINEYTWIGWVRNLASHRIQIGIMFVWWICIRKGLVHCWLSTKGHWSEVHLYTIQASYIREALSVVYPEVEWNSWVNSNPHHVTEIPCVTANTFLSSLHQESFADVSKINEWYSFHSTLLNSAQQAQVCTGVWIFISHIWPHYIYF